MKTKIIITFALLATLAMNGMAQVSPQKYSFELTAGSSFATQKLGGSSLNTGMGFEGIFTYRFYRHIGVYAGWGWNKFAAGTSFAGDDMDFEETGYEFGMHFQHPLTNYSPISYYLRAGALYNHIEIENTDGDIIEDTGHGLGWQLSGGVDIPVGNHWSLRPGIKYNSLSRDLETGGMYHEVDLNHLSLRVGISRKF